MRRRHILRVAAVALATSGRCIASSRYGSRDGCLIFCPGDDDFEAAIGFYNEEEDDPEWEAATKSFYFTNSTWLDSQEYLDDDDDDRDRYERPKCIDGRWLSDRLCHVHCEEGACTETSDGDFICSSCYGTQTEYSDYNVRKGEKFHEKFADSRMSEWTVYEGQFHVTATRLTAGEAVENQALLHRRKMADFIFEGDIALDDAGAGGDAGLVFRATNINEARDGHGGYYYAGINASGHVVLSHMPSGVPLASVATDAQPRSAIHLKVQVVGETISVYVDDMLTPEMVCRDTAFPAGFNGVRVHKSSATFGNITVTPVAGQLGMF